MRSFVVRTIGQKHLDADLDKNPYADVRTLEGELLNVAFAPKLVGVLPRIAPLDVRFLVLPVPRFDEDDVALVDPRAVFHPAGNPSHPVFAILALDADVVSAVVLGYDTEHLVARGHPKISTPCFFTHTYQ
jgi:hypothetical protein